jgi:hypothetical protein
MRVLFINNIQHTLATPFFCCYMSARAAAYVWSRGYVNWSRGWICRRLASSTDGVAFAVAAVDPATGWDDPAPQLQLRPPATL